MLKGKKKCICVLKIKSSLANFLASCITISQYGYIVISMPFTRSVTVGSAMMGSFSELFLYLGCSLHIKERLALEYS